jgi:hypothetical protein
MRMGLALLGGLLAAAGLPTGPARADVAPSVMIVPGQSIGPVRLGMSARDVTSVLGNPVPSSGGEVKFPRVAVTVTLEDGDVVRVSTTNPLFRTPRGAGVGSDVDDSARLIGDPNQSVSLNGTDTTIVYPFQGVGFVFRGGRAVEVFVVEAIALSPPPPPQQAVPTPPPGLETAQSAPVPWDIPMEPTAAGDPGTAPAQPAPAAAPAQPAPSATPSQAAPSVQEALAVRGLAEVVDDRGMLRITGTLVNTTDLAVGPVALTASFFGPTGVTVGQATSGLTSAMLAAGDEAPFTFEGSVAQSVVLQYSVDVAVGGAVSGRGMLARRTIPRDAYANLARSWVRVSVQLGAPSNVGPRVQVLVSISGTGPMPSDWLAQAEVQVPFTGGSATVTLAPGQTLTIFIPSVAQVGTPQVQRVVLNGS